MAIQPNFSNTSSQEHSLFFSQHFSYQCLLRTMPLVQLLIRIDTSWPLSPILNCYAHFSTLPTLYTPHSLCTTSLSHPPLAATCDPTYLNKPLPLTVRSFVSHAFDPHYHSASIHKFTLTYIHSRLSSFAYSTKLTY